MNETQIEAIVTAVLPVEMKVNIDRLVEVRAEDWHISKQLAAIRSRLDGVGGPKHWHLPTKEREALTRKAVDLGRQHQSCQDETVRLQRRVDELRPALAAHLKAVFAPALIDATSRVIDLVRQLSDAVAVCEMMTKRINAEGGSVTSVFKPMFLHCVTETAQHLASECSTAGEDGAKKSQAASC
jgi:hypothetical protein